VNVDPDAALAVNVTMVPLTYGSEQSDPHVIPAGLDVTVPAPRSAWFTFRMTSSLNVAVTVRAAFMDTVHVAPAEVSHPVHPVNVDPDAALAVNVTVMPLV
jgi:hypothetical protein